jgi:hypothetical protein
VLVSIWNDHLIKIVFLVYCSQHPAAEDPVEVSLRGSCMGDVLVILLYVSFNVCFMRTMYELYIYIFAIM